MTSPIQLRQSVLRGLARMHAVCSGPSAQDPHSDTAAALQWIASTCGIEAAEGARYLLSTAGWTHGRGSAPDPAPRPTGATPNGSATAQKEHPNQEQLDALRAYAEGWEDDGWKRRLRLDWSRAGSDWEGPFHLLQQLRNSHGPAWLLGFDLWSDPA